MEAVVHQPFGQVINLQADAALEGAQIENAFVGHPTIGAPKQHRKVGIQALGNHIGRQQGHLTGSAQAASSHHADVHPADRQDAGAAQGCCGHLVWSIPIPIRAWQEGHQVACHRDRTHPRTTAAMGDAEGLVQVEMADISPIEAGLTEPHLGVEVGAVEIHLASVVVDQIADLAQIGLKHPMGGWVGDHQGRQLTGMGLDLGRQVHLINGVVLAGDRHHLHARHHRTGWVGAMGAHRYQTHLAVTFAATAMPGPDGQQPGVFPLGAGIRLERHACKTGDRCQPALELGGQLLVTSGLGRRSKGMQLAKGWPTHGRQFSRRIELHGATAQGDHSVDQGQVFADQALDVAEQFGFAAVLVKHGLAEPGAPSPGQVRPGQLNTGLR